MYSDQSAVIPGQRYRDAMAAIEWLERVLDFRRQAVYSDEHGVVHHAQLVYEGGMLMLGSSREDTRNESLTQPDRIGGKETRLVYMITEDAGSAYERAVAAGADVIEPLHDTTYGSREFAVRDPEGNTWNVGTFNPWRRI